MLGLAPLAVCAHPLCIDSKGLTRLTIGRTQITPRSNRSSRLSANLCYHCLFSVLSMLFFVLALALLASIVSGYFVLLSEISDGADAAASAGSLRWRSGRNFHTGSHTLALTQCVSARDESSSVEACDDKRKLHRLMSDHSNRKWTDNISWSLTQFLKCDSQFSVSCLLMRFGWPVPRGLHLEIAFKPKCRQIALSL